MPQSSTVYYISCLNWLVINYEYTILPDYLNSSGMRTKQILLLGILSDIDQLNKRLYIIINNKNNCQKYWGKTQGKKKLVIARNLRKSIKAIKNDSNI